MFYSKRKPEIKMLKYNKLYLLIIVVFLTMSQYKGQILKGHNPINQKTDIFLIDDSGARETSIFDGSIFGTESEFGLPPYPFAAIALLMIPILMMTLMSTSVAPRPIVTAAVSVTVPTNVLGTISTTQAVVQSTPCIPTSCPADYILLEDQTASPNCYFYSGESRKIWSDAMKVCTMTQGAYLWRPNTEQEADAARNTFKFENDVHIWTGAHSPTHDENYVFAVDNAAFLLSNLPFGVLDIDGNIGEDCVDIEFDTVPADNSNIWEWENEFCGDDQKFICELPRKICP